MKTKLIACLVLLSTFIATQCSPIDFLSQLTDEGERMLMKRLEDYLNSDYSDDSSSSTYSNGVQTRGVTARQENCRLPMKRGLCRALLPRFRYVWSMNFKIERLTRPIIIKIKKKLSNFYAQSQHWEFPSHLKLCNLQRKKLKLSIIIENFLVWLITLNLYFSHTDMIQSPKHVRNSNSAGEWFKMRDLWSWIQLIVN